jgi:hypothetical protein
VFGTIIILGNRNTENKTAFSGGFFAIIVAMSRDQTQPLCILYKIVAQSDFIEKRFKKAYY